MWCNEYSGVCGCDCGPITKEEKTAVLDRQEKILKEKLELIEKLKESLKSEKPAKEK